MPLRVKLAAALRALGLDPDNVDWNHNPPIQLRRWDPETGDTDPPANDPRFIEPLDRAEHKTLTAKRDVPAIARTKRAEKKRAARQAMADAEAAGQKVKAKRKSRPIPKGPSFAEQRARRDKWLREKGKVDA